MKCIYCGFESNEDFALCPACSKEVSAAPVNPVGEKVKAALCDKMFLIVCILMTASAAFGFLSDGVPVFEVLFSIFLWIAFSKARKNIVDTRQLRNLSGTVYAKYVVLNVLSIILLVFGVLFGVLGSVLGGAGLSDSLLSEFGEFDLALSGTLILASGWIVFAVCVIAAAIILIISILGWRKIHRFAKSVYQSIDSYSDNVQYASAAKNWILAFGILTAVSALTSGDFTAILANGCSAGATLLSYLLINKYLADKQ